MRVTSGVIAIVTVATTVAMPGIAEAATPPGSQAQFSAVTCQANGCTAAGDYVNSAGLEAPLVEHRSGTKWAVQAAPAPVGAESSSFSGVSCAAGTPRSGGGCEAVGSVTDSTGAPMAFSESRSKKKWAIQTVQVPSETERSDLSAVSCTQARFCMAVGSYTNSKGVTAPLAEEGGYPTWVPETPPVPTGAKSSDLSSISCVPSPLACTAVGSYTIKGGIQETLVDEWFPSGGWYLQTSVNPPDAASSDLLGVSCVTDTCTAVGDKTASGATSTLAEQGLGSTWELQTTPNPPGASSGLDAVSCDPSYSCIAVGVNQDPTVDQAFAEIWDGTQWTLQTTASPKGVVADELLGASCTATSACTAAGDYTDSNGDQLPLVEVWNGTSWAVQKIAKLPA
jgi:hypothetical protein